MSGFRNIYGHEKTIAHLRSAIVLDQVSHAYLISGDEGMGKKTLARAFAQTLQCENLQMEVQEMGRPAAHAAPDDASWKRIDACGLCGSCKQTVSGNQPDILTWSHEKVKLFSVDDARKLAEDIQIRPFSGRYKIYIVPDAQMMNVQAQNALLKTLEEPPEYAVLILLTTSTDAMLETIRSRCVLLDLKPVEDAKVRQYLMEQCEIPDYEADICVAFAQGNIGKAVSLAGSEDFRETMDRAVRILTHIRDWEMEEISAEVKALVPYKLRIDDLLDLFAVWYRDVLFFKATRQIDGIIFREQTSAVRKAARESSYEGVQMILDAIRKAKDRLRANVNFELTIELLLLAMKEN